MPRWCIPLFLLLAVGCGGARKAVRLDTGRGSPTLFIPHAGRAAPGELDERDFKPALQHLAPGLRTFAKPLESARREFRVPPRSGSYRYEARSRRLLADDDRALLPALPQVDSELTRAYLSWCERALSPGDCLRVLEDGSLLSGDGKYALAMAIAQGSVLGETRDALRKMAHPDAVISTVVSAATVYMMLWLLPEPISKGLAATLTVGLLGYLGYETVWALISGWMQLVDAVDRATTFEEIRAAGERYGRVMGEDAARVLVMLATAAVGHTSAELASKLPTLPGAGPVAAAVEGQLGVRYGAVAEVHSVAVSAEGVTIALTPGALAMVARGPPPPATGPGEWVEENASMSEDARDYQAQVTGAAKGYAYRVTANGDKVDFDGFKNGTLLEAKGPGYAKFFDATLNRLGFFKGADKLLAQAERQLRVARGTPIRWIVAEEKFAAALRLLLKGKRIPIEVDFIPPTPNTP